MFITVPFLEIEAPTLTVDQPAEGASFENGAIPVAGHGHERGDRSWSAPRTSGRPAPAPAGGKPTPAPPAAPAPVTVDGRRGRRRSARRYELTAGNWAITVTASGAEGKTASLTRARHGRLQGRQPRRDRQGRPGLAQGLGRRQARSGRRGGRPGHRQRQVPDVHRQGLGRGPDRLVGRDATSRSTARRSARSGKSGMPETWLFAPPERARKDPAALSRGRRPARRRWPTSRSVSGRCAEPRPARRDRRVVHRRAGRPPHHRGPGFERLLRRRLRDLLGRAQARAGRRAPTTCSRRTARSRPRSRWRWRPAAGSGSGADLAVVGDRHRRAGRRAARPSRSA